MVDQRQRLRVLDGLASPDLWPEIEGRRPRPGAHALEASRGRRAVTVGVALAVGVAGVLVAETALGPRGRQVGSLDTQTWATGNIKGLHLAFSHPREWSVQPFDELVGHAGFVGALVSNVDHRFRHPDQGPNNFTTAWSMRGLPADAVVISIERVEGPSFTLRGVIPDSRRPLDLGRARRLGGDSPDSAWVRLWMPFVLDGRSDDTRVWFGPEASDHDREVARRIVASIQPIPSDPLGGWLVDVQVIHSASGPLEIDVGSIRPAPENDAHPWIQHTIILRNTGSRTLRFDDTRVSMLLGMPKPELLAADEGCGYSRESKDAPIEAGACLTYLDAFTIPPHSAVRKTVTLFKGLEGMAPLQEGRYVFLKIYRFQVGDSSAKRTVHVRLIYDVRSGP